MIDLVKSAKKIQDFKHGDLTKRIANLEAELEGAKQKNVLSLCFKNKIDNTLLHSAITLKEASGQIDTVIHTIGMMSLLPKILQRGELIESVSLGAGNTGKKFDLETNRRIAEFKFIHWKGGPESIRQNSLFKDFFYLAEADINKERYLYVIGLKHPLNFLKGGRDISSVLKDKKLSNDYLKLYGNRYSLVREYYAFRKNRVEIRDINEIMPSFARSINKPIA